MRKLLVLGVVCALLVAGDTALRIAASNRLAREIGRELELAEPDVSISGFPFVVAVFRGRFEEVSASVDEVERDGITVEDVTVVLRRVRAPVGAVLQGDLEKVRARSGTGEMSLPVVELDRALGDRGVPISVAGRDGDLFIVVGGTSIDADAEIQDGVLVIRQDDGVAPASLDLPEVVPGLSYRSVVVEGDELRFGFDVGPVSLGGQ